MSEPLDLEAIEAAVEAEVFYLDYTGMRAPMLALIAEVRRLREEMDAWRARPAFVLDSPEALDRRHGDTGGRLMDPEGGERRGYAPGLGPRKGERP